MRASERIQPISTDVSDGTGNIDVKYTYRCADCGCEFAHDNLAADHWNAVHAKTMRYKLGDGTFLEYQCLESATTVQVPVKREEKADEYGPEIPYERGKQRIAGEMLWNSDRAKPARQHVSDAAWAAVHGPEAGRDTIEKANAKAGVMLVTVEEWDGLQSALDRRLNPPPYPPKLQATEEERDLMRAWAEKFKADLDSAESKLLDANIRIEWLERQLAKCGAPFLGLGWTVSPALGGMLHHPDDPVEVTARNLLTTPNLTDPRFGR